MKFKTFRMLVIVGGIALGVGLVALFLSSENDQIAEYEAQRSEERPIAQRGKKGIFAPGAERMLLKVKARDEARSTAPTANEPVADAAPAAEATGEGEALRAIDGRILERVKAGISGDKEKDALRGEAWKVNIYKDAGETQPNRLKIDYDRDEKWDEKWTFEREGTHTEVKRFVAPADDENYAVEYRMRAGRWVQVSK